MTLNRKALKTISLYVFVGLVALAAFLYVRFPSALFRDYFIASVAAGYPDLSLSLGDVKPRFPPALLLEKVILQSKTRTDVSFQADSLIIQPVLTSLLKGQTSLNLHARGYGGRMEGAVTSRKSFSLSEPAKLTLAFENLPIERISCLHDFFGRTISGKLRGSLSFDGLFQNFQDGKGQFKFTLMNGSYQLFENLAGFDKLDFNVVDGQASLSDRILKIGKLTITDEKLNLSLKGEITLGADNFKSSQLNLTGSIEVRTPVLKRVSFSLTGTMENPVTKLS